MTLFFLQPQLKDEDVKMEDLDASSKGSKDDDSGSTPVKPHWMKSKLPGGETDIL